MSATSKSANPFEGLADRYQKFRPDYPEALLAALRDRAAATGAGPRLVVDVGAGTGIATRALKRAFGPEWEAVGVEPGDDMRRRAAEIEVAGVRYLSGGAESLPLPDGAAGVVAVAQAIQFFDRPVFYEEARRTLAAGGTLAVIQNNRQWRASALLDEYEAFVETNDPTYSRDYRDIDLLAEMEALAWARDAVRLAEGWTRPMDADGFVGMTLSRRTMKPAVARLGEATVEAALRDMCARHGGADGRVDIPYETELFITTKA